MGAIRYYPLSRVKTGLTTNGNQFQLNGQPYRGSYYLTYDGNAYTGPNPAQGGNEQLLPLTLPAYAQIDNSNPRTASTKRAQEITTAFKPVNTVRNTTLRTIVPTQPLPVESDYVRGYFTRYFVKRINMRGYVMEVSEEDWTAVTNGENDQLEAYEGLDMFWQLKGPRNDTRVSQYEIKGGVYDTNKRVTENKAKGFAGLLEFIGGDYTKFARLDSELEL